MPDITLSPDQIELKEKLKTMMKEIKKETESAALQEMRQRFKEILDRTNPLIIALAEQDLANEGMSMNEFLSVCDIHLELFREKVQNPDLSVPPDHPIARFQEDHRFILNLMDQVRETIKRIAEKDSWNEVRDMLPPLKALLDKLMEVENHNIRQESALFPALEKHGIEKPPAIMWQEHTEMRQDKKALLKLFEQNVTMDFPLWVNQMYSLAMKLYEKFLMHTQKEQNILYKVALDTLSQQEWLNVKEATEEIGFFDISDRNG
jgi:hypothetical protein